MYWVVAEDVSDFRTLRVIIRRLADNPKLDVKGKGFDGCGDLMAKGAKYLRSLGGVKQRRFIACYDSDEREPSQSRDELFNKVIKPSGVADRCCAVVPVKEIEAWILADYPAVSKVFTSWRVTKRFPSPESFKDPKKFLYSESEGGNGKPRYNHVTHNEKIAEHLDLMQVEKRCPSFKVLKEFVLKGE